MALTSALCSAVATILIQRGLRRSNFYAGFWINVLVGVIGLWSAVVLFVPREAYSWRAVPYFVLSGAVGTTGGRLFRVIAIEKVGAPVAASIGNLTPLMATGRRFAASHAACSTSPGPASARTRASSCSCWRWVSAR